MNDSWRAYFWFMVIVLTIYTPMLAAMTDAAWPDARITAVLWILSYAVDIVSMVALFGYYKKRKLAVRSFWIFVFFVLSAGTVLKHYNYWRNFEFVLEEMTPIIGGLISVFYVSITIPLAVGVYLYAFKSNGLWFDRV
jgi:hypothetical protein